MGLAEGQALKPLAEQTLSPPACSVRDTPVPIFLQPMRAQASSP